MNNPTTPINIKNIFNNGQIGAIITVNGWVRNRRDSKIGFSFISLNDGSTFNLLQIIAPNSLHNYSTEIIKLTKDCAITITGEIVRSEGLEQSIEILAHEIKVIGAVENPESYPISSKRHTPEYLRTFPHLRIRTNLLTAITGIRNSVSFAIHEYLQQQDFYWIHTPIITGLDAEGAGEMFHVSNFNFKDFNKLPKTLNGALDFKKDFFHQDAFLTVSGQLHAEAYALALSKVYTFGPTFRAENSNTTRHLAEFWMIEPEIAFANLSDDIDLAQKLIKYIFHKILNNNSLEMEFFAKFINPEVINRLTNIVNNDFEVLDYTKAISYLEATSKKFDNPIFWGVDLASEHERWLCEEHIGKPTIIINYPKDIKAFYMKLNPDNKTVAAMDILAPGIGEIAGGSQREESYELLKLRMQQLNMDTEHLSWYLDLRRFGSVPHAGFGIGLERLISYITGVANIRELIAFPRASGLLPM